MTEKYIALIIDDSKPISFFNKIVLERSGLFSQIQIVENGKEALDLLNTDFFPSVIFLDLNMPVMNGWTFLEEYSKLSNEVVPIILLIGSTLSHNDQKLLEQYPVVKDVRSKTLSHDAVLRLQKDYL